MRAVVVDFSGLAMTESLEHSWSVILSSALALAIIASIDALLCAKLTSQPGELRAGDDRLLVRLGIANAVSAAFGGITQRHQYRAKPDQSRLRRTQLALGHRQRRGGAGGRDAAVSATSPISRARCCRRRVMVVAIQHIDPPGPGNGRTSGHARTPQRGAIALDLGVSLFVSLLSIAINVVLAVVRRIALAVFLFRGRMSRSNIRKLYRCDAVRSRR